MPTKKIRYAVVGLGNISQIAALPGFEHCHHSELKALVSGDRDKLHHLGKKYKVDQQFTYDEYEQCLQSGEIDAAYIALPNHLHREYTERAARCGIHVLCEKPMAVSSEECESMIAVCRKNRVKLMIAYRLHFEDVNLKVIDLVKSGSIGYPKLFMANHSQPIREENIRTYPIEAGGGPTYDMGIYGINAARYLFRSEPRWVYAQAVWGKKKPYRDIEESMAIVLEFSGNRLAMINTSFGTAGADQYRLYGSEGEIRLEQAFTYFADKTIELVVSGKCKKYSFSKQDQFAAQFDYFSNCILKNQSIEPNGKEGLLDVKVIEAIFESARTGRRIELDYFQKEVRPSLRLEVTRPPIESKPEQYKSTGPSRKGEAA